MENTLAQLTEARALLVDLTNRRNLAQQQYDSALRSRNTALASRDALPNWKSDQRNYYQNIINRSETAMRAALAQISSLDTQLAQTRETIQSLTETLDAQNQARETLAQQGITPEAIESSAQIIAQGEAQAKVEAEKSGGVLKLVLIVALLLAFAVGLFFLIKKFRA